MRHFTNQTLRKSLRLPALLLAVTLSGCVQTAPQDLVEAIEGIDQELVVMRAAEFVPEEYSRFAHHWIAVKAQLAADDDLIRWPWEPNHFETALEQLKEEGTEVLAVATHTRDSQRAKAQSQLVRIEDRLRSFTTRVAAIESRVVLGRKSVDTELLVKQARSFFEQGEFERSLRVSGQAAKMIGLQTGLLTAELGRYADEERVSAWKEMVQRTIDWSRTNHTTAIVVNKADRKLVLYRNGHKAHTYPVSLGYNGILEKRYQGDGATPEGQYRITRKRGQGQTQFYRALVIDYPNAEDRRRFGAARKSGDIPAGKGIGGQIEIHGVDNPFMNQTLGCIMLGNLHMAALFDRVDAGTMVTIVGALHIQNSVSLALAELGDSQEET
ncbi:MAG: L,D-transpeptidase family protein [Nitrospiraceae bacterium]